MTKKKAKANNLSRRHVLPILGSSLFLPFFGMGSEDVSKQPIEDDAEYEILLKPDGSTVKVKRSTLKKSKVVKKGLSNSSLLNWLDKKE